MALVRIWDKLVLLRIPNSRRGGLIFQKERQGSGQRSMGPRAQGQGIRSRAKGLPIDRRGRLPIHRACISVIWVLGPCLFPIYWQCSHCFHDANSAAQKVLHVSTTCKRLCRPSAVSYLGSFSCVLSLALWILILGCGS